MPKSGNFLKLALATATVALLANAVTPSKTEAQRRLARRPAAVATVGAGCRVPVPVRHSHSRTFVHFNMGWGYPMVGRSFYGYRGFYPNMIPPYAVGVPIRCYPVRVPCRGQPEDDDRTVEIEDSPGAEVELPAGNYNLKIDDSKGARIVIREDKPEQRTEPQTTSGRGPEPGPEDTIWTRYGGNVAEVQVDDVIVEYLYDLFRTAGKDYVPYDIGEGRVGIRERKNGNVQKPVIYIIRLKNYYGKTAREIVGGVTNEMLMAGMIGLDDISERAYENFSADD